MGVFRKHSPKYHILRQWPEPSRQLESLLEEKLPVSSLQLRLLVSQLQLLEVSRSPTGTDQARWHSGRSGGTRSQQSRSSGSCHSRGWLERLPRILRLTSDSSPRL